MKLSEVFAWTEQVDPRTKDWPLVSPIYHILFIIFIYFFLVFYWIPRYMKNKPPYKLTTYIKCYNVFQVVVNSWLVREHIAAGWLKNIPFTCVVTTYSYEFPHYKFAQIIWWVLLLKIVDLTETIVFALRKKDKQISTHHVYHHVSTVLLLWVSVKYVSGESSTFSTLLNCSVHMLMYTFYFLAAFGPRVQAIISPFKQFVTIIQMVQLFAIIIYSLQILAPGCNTSIAFPTIILVNVAINLYMFYKFYRKTYISKMKQ
nr:PREDICTED: elongation of very long chain fatty acids protein AAEL008004-like [Linepithema humile]